jgi:RpiR family carbohydrate utilization transcriptional regulator
MPQSDTLFLKIKSLIPSLNPALKKIARYIIDNPSRIKYLKIKELAEICGVSEATVTRFVKTTGCKSFQELKIKIVEITRDKQNEKEFVYDDVSQEDTVDSIINKIVYINCKALEDTKKIINANDINTAISALDRAEKIDVYCAGGSYVAAENARIRFYRIGKRCVIYNDPNQQAISASLLTPKDAAIGISNSGRTVSTVNALRRARECGATTLCITNHDKSPITEYADVKLFTSVHDPTFFQESMISRLAQILIIDILYAGLAVKHFPDSVRMIEKSSASLKDVLL